MYYNYYDAAYKMACGIAKIEYEKSKDKLEKKRQNNEKIANSYIELVLAFIDSFDYDKSIFNVESINAQFLTLMFGNPSFIGTSINNATKIASINVKYERSNDLKLIGLPDFFEENTDFMLISDILRECGIELTSNIILLASGKDDCYSINFDASMLLSKYDSLLNNGKNISEEDKEKVKCLKWSAKK